ncbi:MAG: ABC transporter permease [Oscillospiraceae bacterium]
MKARMAMFYKYRFLLQNLIQRDLRVKYRRSKLGVLWSVLNPLLMMVVMSAVFSFFFKSDIPNYPVYLLSGQLLFVYFVDSTSAAMASVIGSAALIKKVYVPKYIFPLEKSCFAFINMSFSMVALLLVMVVTGAKIPWTLPLALFPMLTLFGFCLGIGMFLASSAIFFRDIMHLWTVFTTALMYATPIFYPVEILKGTIMSSLIQLNPMYWYVGTFRRIVVNGLLPTPNQIVVCTVCAIIALVVGMKTFKNGQDRFILFI